MAEDFEESRPRRAVDTSNRDAREAVAAVAKSLEPLQARVAFIAARARRPLQDDERDALAAQCDDIRAASRAARQDLIVALMDAPARVAGHSRVVDVERALDSLDIAVADVVAELRS